MWVPKLDPPLDGEELVEYLRQVHNGVLQATTGEDKGIDTPQLQYWATGLEDFERLESFFAAHEHFTVGDYPLHWGPPILYFKGVKVIVHSLSPGWWIPVVY